MADRPTSAEEGTARAPLCTLLERDRDEILARWEARARRLAKARPLDQPALRDHLPELIDEVCAALDHLEAAEGSGVRIAEVHAVERLDEGFDLDEVAAEFAVLREELLRHLEERDYRPTISELLVINRVIDGAIVRSTHAFARARERTLRALDRITEAALDSDRAGEFLPRLLRVLMETTAAVDSVALYLLDEGGQLSRFAQVGWEDDGAADRALLGFPEDVLKAGDAVVRGRLFGDRVNGAVRVLYGIPLIEGDRAIGVAAMGSRTAYEFSEEDRQLFRVMVHRATDLVIRSQLASREERARAAAERSENALRAAERKLELDERVIRGVLDVLPLSAVVTDAAGRALLANRASRELWGDQLALSEVPLPEIMTEANGASIPRERWPLERALRNGETVRLEPVRATPPGRPSRDLLVSAAPIVGRQGEPIGAVVVHQDVSALTHAIAERRQEEQRLRQVLDGVRDYAIFTLDAQGRIRSWNLGAEQIFGRSEAEVLGEDTGILFCEEERCRDASRALLEQAARTGRAEGEGERVRRDGTRFHAQFAIGALQGEQGELVGFAQVLHDESERQRAALEAEQNARFQEQFVGILGHDLRNPLSAISASAEILFRRGGLSEAHQKAVARIASSAQRMARMINDLLDLTRSRQGGLPIAPQPVNLHELTRHVVEELEVANPTRKLELGLEGDGAGVLDPDRIAQVVSNLVGNALEHGEPDAPVEIRSRGLDGNLELSVRNRGKPIPPELLPRLFDPYRRGRSEAGKTRGLGLGLYIAQQIVLSHGGTIDVRSSAEEGTEFTVRLPRQR